ncbi:MAG: hypothetical protein IPN17_06160 [Deltaproteobacteria bacterium]|nr:hypothetical protein [Deltaproteobacteria bacterium]MBK8691885.1 hypothetical protein [Deltaproteobacteria bacterium]MBP6833774.1 hypothetical protein [Deltaproteobacteria bacterium]
MRSAWFAVALAVSGVPAVAEAFTVQVPEGWVDLSRGAPAANFEGLRPTIAAQVQSRQYVALAYDFAHEDDGFTENLNATIQSGAERVTGRSIAALTRELPAIAARNTPSVALRVLESSVVLVGGVHRARLLTEVTVNGSSVRQAVFLIPGAGQTLVLTYSSSPQEFARYLPTFDTSAAATVGAVEPPEPEGPWKGILQKTLIGGVIGALGGLLQTLFRRAKS